MTGAKFARIAKFPLIELIEPRKARLNTDWKEHPFQINKQDFRMNLDL